MSVYDCEPPQLDCDFPPPLNDLNEEESSKTREHENFDLEDDEFPSFSIKLNEHSAITSNALHIYDSSPPPVDDFFIRRNSHLDDIEIPKIDCEKEECEDIKVNCIINDDDVLNQIDIPELDPITPPNIEKNDAMSLTFEDFNNVEDVASLTKKNTSNESVNNDMLICKDSSSNFILEDLPDDSEDNFESSKIAFEESSLEKIPESQQELYDSFDNFTDFEQAIPIDRHIEHRQFHIEEEKSEPNEVHFEADFGAFEANFDNEFQSFNSSEVIEPSTKNDQTVVNKHEPLMCENEEDDDDDDFGDFNDFTQGPSDESLPITNEIHTTTHSTVTILNDSEIKTILSEMFPVNQQVINEDSIFSIASKNEEMKVLNDVESTLALNYDYKESSTNHILIKALGIDERNILFGPQWASSHMPRFASDLSFNPLEPSKSTSSTTSHTKNNSSSNISSINSSQANKEMESEILKEPHHQPDIVPEFDWNGAGLTNPLDAHNNYLLGLEHLNQIPSYSRTNNDDVLRQFDSLDSNKYVVKNRTNSKQIALKSNEESLPYDLSTFEITQKNPEIIKPDVDNSLKNNLAWQNERFDVQTTVVRERTIKLPETHIFTPIKSISPVAREVSRETSPIEADKEKRPVVIKEYHDIEYSLEQPSKKTELENDFGDFNEFQSATESVKPINPSILLPTSILEPQKVFEPHKPEISSNINVQDNDLLATDVNKANQMSKYDVFGELSKTSKNNKSIEDDFADFQAAPTLLSSYQKPPTTEKHTYKEDSSITLSPSKLVNNMQKMPHSSQNTLSTWMNDTLDSDEISRIEAAFPKCKVDSNKKKQQQHQPHQILEVNYAKDDDEWCDFQSVSQSSTIISANTLHTVPNQSSSLINSESMKVKTCSDNIDTSDWSDFVSVPVKPSINASQFLSKPNFSSWNQPVGKPYVNHTTSFLSSNNYPGSQFDGSLYSNNMLSDKNMMRTTRQPMTITNNFNYNNFDRQDTSSIPPPYQMSNGISTILPDLQFALPKTLINLSRGNGSDTTKK